MLMVLMKPGISACRLLAIAPIRVRPTHDYPYLDKGEYFKSHKPCESFARSLL